MATTLSTAPFSLSAADAIAGLGTARARTQALVAGLATEDLERIHSPLMSPLAWDLGHIAAYEDLWLVHRHGGRALLRPDLAGLYDAFETPRARRGDVERLDPTAAQDYLAEVRARTLQVIEQRGVGDGAVHEMVIQHEAQHNETMLQTLGLARLAGAPPAPGRPAPPAPGGHSGLEFVEVAEGPFALGAPADRFAYDNERPAHVVDLPAFAIGRTPVTNAAWLDWTRQGGYARGEWWSEAGWDQRRSDGLEHPGGWKPAAEVEPGYVQWRPGGWRALALDEPVVHVSCFEAEAFARAHGARLPTEAEWEKAATHDPAAASTRDWPWGERGGALGRANLLESDLCGPAAAGAFPDGQSPCGALGMLGDVWEWTGSDFTGYPGFRFHPYREYSEVFFGSTYRALRGGAWASSERVVTPTFRNWDLPQRRQIFAGVRLARDL